MYLFYFFSLNKIDKYDKGIYAYKYANADLFNVVILKSIKNNAFKIGIASIILDLVFKNNGDIIKYAGNIINKNIIATNSPQKADINLIMINGIRNIKQKLISKYLFIY